MPSFDLIKSHQKFDNQSFSSHDFLTAEDANDSRMFRKKRTRIVIMAVGLVCLVAIIIGLAVGLSNKSAEENAGEQGAQEGVQPTTSQATVETTTVIVKSTTATVTEEVHTSSTAPTTLSSVSTTTASKETITSPRVTATSPAKTTKPSEETTAVPTVTATSTATTPNMSTVATSRPTTRPGDWMSTSCSHPADVVQCPWSQNPVLLVSLDGFRAEYLLRNLTPTIQKLHDCGVHTPYMRAVYPTLTFPNHYTIVTGLYPEAHGIVGNSMYDASMNSSFSIGGNEKFDSRWWGGEPLWVTAKKNGRKTASYYWVGSEMNISGTQPDIWKPYNGSITYEERIDTVLGWLELPDTERPEFITVYFDEPDHEGHGSGPDSEQVNAMLKRVDMIVGRLMDGLHSRGMENCVNLIVLADHGMAETSCQRQVNLDYYMTAVDNMLIYSGTTGHIDNKYRRVNSVVLENDNVVPLDEILGSLQCKSSHMNVFTRSDVPARHHFANNPRIGDVLLDVEQTWLVYPKKSSSCLKGNHGYDNVYKSMHALFLAHGPDFQQNLQVEPFENIELYNLMADLLHLQPAPNNGTRGALDHLLRNPMNSTITPPNNFSVCSSSGRTRVLGCACNNMSEVSPPSAPGEGLFPFGMPVAEKSLDACFLPGKQFSSLYSKVFKAPVLSSFSLSKDQMKNYSASSSRCLIEDPRISSDDDPDCSVYANVDQAIDYTFLFDSGFSESPEAHLSTNKVPMYRGFKEGVWNYAWRIAKEYATVYEYIHISVGPIYDHNFDGLADMQVSNNTKYVGDDSSVPLPSHFYLMMIKCVNSSVDLSQCNERDFDILSFVVPHQNRTNNCLTHKDFLENNVVRIRDIELLTGLKFLTSFNEATSARLRTFLPLQLWPSPLSTSWVDLPCPIINASCPAGRMPLVLVSLDGFRADYLERQLTPTIQRLSQCGVHTPYMRSVYPTVTFPNHYTIVTGLYPESHGIISNNMYDEEIDKIFSLSAATSKDPRWWKGEPIWITAKKYGLKTATYFWPGSEVNRSGILPDFWKVYDGKTGYTRRVYDVLDWLTLPEDSRPDFITLYFDEPDHAGHNSGPVSEEVDGQLETVDELINILMSNLYEKGLHNCINLIILADHGMSDQSCDKKVRLKDFYTNITDILVFDETFGQVFPQYNRDNSTDAHTLNASYSSAEIVESLMCKHSAMSVFTKDTMPRRHHFTHSDRIADISINMKDKWIVLSDTTTWCTGGNHGWDNTYKNMHALFLAHGPAFKENFTAEPFENIELYNLMTEVLNFSAAPNNGTQGSLRYMLRNATALSNEGNLNHFNTCQADIEDAVGSCGCEQQRNLSASDIFLSDDDEVFFWGSPVVTSDDVICLLHQNNYSVAFSDTFNSPVVLVTKLLRSTSNFTSVDNFCKFNDSRVISRMATCTDAISVPDMKMYPLTVYGTDISNGSYLTTTLVPLYKGFYTGIWTYVHELLQDYRTLYGDLSVTVGTIYDYNNDGLYEGIWNTTKYADSKETLPIPTHIYAIIIKCRLPGDQLPCNGDLDILSFILPNLHEIPNCQRSDVYLKDNVARIRDIELLTKLQFLTTFDVDQSARLRTFLAEDIWQTSLARTWEEEPCPQQDMCNSDYRPLLLISLDGFRADYLLRNMTPTISRLSQCGVHAPYMRSVYPTKTFPNHYTIVTGLYPESHGIIDNNMYDMEIGKRFSLGSETASDPRWWGGEPIWLTAKKQGLRTATYFWPGSDVKIQGIYPDIWKKYDGSVSYYSRVQEVLSWMSLPKGERPDFITLYFDEPDLAGHKYGTSGPTAEKEIGATLARVDETIGELMNGLYSRNLHHCVNLVIIADHGMDDVSCQRVVRLRNYVDMDYLSSNFYVWEGTFGRIANQYIYNSTIRDPAPNGNPELTDELLKNLTCADPHLNVYTKTTLPVRHHYTNNNRIDSVLLDVESEWLVTRSWIKTCSGGNHGYDNIYKSMEALFLAYGPAFHWNLTIPAFENIELYNTFADILNITAAPNNGTTGALDHILKSPRERNNSLQRIEFRHADNVFHNSDEYLSYVKTVNCGYNCTQLTDEQIKSVYNETTNFREDVRHVPLGIPLMKLTNITLLHQPNYTSAYDSRLRIVLWISQTRDGQSVLLPEAETNCSLPDPRISAGEEECYNATDVLYSPLYSGTTVGSPPVQIVLTSSFVRMTRKFYASIWLNVLYNIWKKYSASGKDYNILMGPAFDLNHDGISDDFTYISSADLPSHFFVMLTSCPTNTTLEACDNHRVESYIIPHSDNLKLCKDIGTFLLENEARARDIELITGIQLFQRLPFDEAVRLKTYLPLSFD